MFSMRFTNEELFGKGVSRDLFGGGNDRPKREPVNRSVRNAVIAKQKMRCKNCRKILNPASTHIDHIKQVAKYGKSDLSNLQALCANCHNEKTNDDRVKDSQKKLRAKRRNGGNSGYSLRDLNINI